MMRKHKKIITAIIFLIVICILNNFLGFALIKTGLTRVIVHELDAGDYGCVVLGQSHSSYGISSDQMDESLGLKTMNMSIGGQYMLDMYYYAKEIFKHNSPKVVVLDVDFSYFLKTEDNNAIVNDMYYEYPFSKEKIGYSGSKLLNRDYRATLFPWINYRENYADIASIIKNKLTDAYKNYSPDSVQQIESEDTYMGRGFIYRSRVMGEDKPKCRQKIHWNESAIDTGASVSYFKKIVDLCRKNGSNVVMVTSPITVDTIVDSKSEYAEIEEFMQKLASENDLTYYNFNLVKPNIFTRTSDDYWDNDGHMYGDCAKRYSKMLGEFLKKVTSGDTIPMNEYFYDSVFDMAKDDLQRVK